MKQHKNRQFFIGLAGAVSPPFLGALAAAVVALIVASVGWYLAVVGGEAIRYHQVFEPAALVSLCCIGASIPLGAVWWWALLKASEE